MNKWALTFSKEIRLNWISSSAPTNPCTTTLPLLAAPKTTSAVPVASGSEPVATPSGTGILHSKFGPTVQRKSLIVPAACVAFTT